MATTLRRTGLPLPTATASEFNLGGAILGGIGGFVTGGPGGAVIGALTGGGLGGSATGGREAGLGGGLAAGCPTGYEYDLSTGQCKRIGLAGLGERLMPGGATGYIPASANGMAGLAAEQPNVFETVRRKCRPGWVLGKDNLCYVRGGKAGITNQQRKWPKPSSPVMSAQDAKVLRRAASLKEKAKKVAQQAGYSCRKR